MGGLDFQSESAIFVLEMKQMDQALIPQDRITFFCSGNFEQEKMHSVSELERKFSEWLQKGEDQAADTVPD